MAIQFLCPACSQPIEVDDQWSARSVACPYCQKTVTAPPESTFQPEPAAPQASPVGSEAYPAAAAGPGYLAARRSGSLIAVCALGLAVGGLMLQVGFRLTVLPKIMELAGPGATPQEIQQAIMEHATAEAMPDWLTYGTLLCMASMALWVAGLVCGIIAVVRSTRRGMALGSLAVTGLTLLTCCIGPGTGG